MPYLNLEVSENTRPVLMISGPQTKVVDMLIEQHKNDFHIIYLSSDATHSNLEDEHFSLLSKESFYYIDRLAPHVDYAVFVADQYTRTIFTGVSQLLEQSQTKTVFVVPESEWNNTLQILPHTLPSICDILFLGHILDFVDEPQNEIDSFIFSALVFSRVPVHNPEASFSVIGLQDAIKGIEQGLFGYQKKREFILLSYDQPSTYISAAHTLKRVEPELSIDLSADDTLHEESHRTKIESMVQSHYHTHLRHMNPSFFSTFESEIKNLFEQNRLRAQQAIFTTEKQNRRKKRSFHISFNHFIFFSFFLGILGWILVQSLLICFAYISAQQGIHDVKDGKTADGVVAFERANSLLSWSHPLLSVLIIPAAKLFPALPSELSLLPSAIKTYTALHSIDFGIKGVDSDEATFTAGIAQMQSFLLNIEKYQSTLSHTSLGGIVSSSFFSYASVLGVTPDLLGYKKDMTYLILFQNNAELRPTGGFIGSVGEIVFHHGKITTFTIQDVYSIDGQLRIHIDPNYVISRNLEPNLYLRDSNFNPNFELSASQAAQIYYDSTQATVDGIIGVDFDVLKQIIHDIGPVYLDSYHVSVTDNTIFSFLENTIQDNFFPGSTQKTSVLSELQTQIQLKLEEHPELMEKILLDIPTLLRQKHILFAFQDSSLEKVFSAEHLSDNNQDLRSPQPNIPDILSVNEANIGVNKVNLSVSRRIHYDVTIPENGHLHSTVTETLINQSSKLDYKTYIQVLTPLVSSLEGISINGSAQHIIPAVTQPRVYESKGFKVPQGFEVDQSDSQYHSIGFITTVSKDTSQTITITYTNGISTPEDTLVHYSLLYFKQPGTETYPFTETISYPQSFSLRNAQGDEGVINQFQKSESIDSDKEVSVDLVKHSGN